MSDDRQLKLAGIVLLIGLAAVLLLAVMSDYARLRIVLMVRRQAADDAGDERYWRAAD